MEQTIENKLIRVDSTNQLSLNDQTNDHAQSIAKLQKEITEMTEMFKSLNEVVEQQNQPITTIGDQIQSATVQTKKAQTELIQAKQYSDKYHYLMFGGGLVLTLIGGPVVLGIKVTCVVASGFAATAMGVNYLNK